MLIIVTLLFATVGMGALAAGAWLWRMLRWEVVDDDKLHYEISKGRRAPGSWRKLFRSPSRLLLTYRRDELGRFRRYRR